MRRFFTIPHAVFLTCLSVGAAHSETADQAMSRIFDTPPETAAEHVKSVIKDRGCSFWVPDDMSVDKAATEIATQMAEKMNVAVDLVPDVRGALMHAFEQGSNQLMRDGIFEVDYKNGAVSYKGCQ